MRGGKAKLEGADLELTKLGLARFDLPKEHNRTVGHADISKRCSSLNPVPNRSVHSEPIAN